MAYIMDTNEEERVKGITVEVGRAHFETAKKRYTILDAPGHKNYVPNMIQGACQADVAILLVSARKGEFETGFERGGQTREHAQLAKTLGVSRLVVVVNKLDCPSVALPGGKWDKGRYDSIVNGITPFLKSCGYNLKKEVVFLPVAALYGHNIKDGIPAGTCDWYTGATLFDTLDKIEAVDRNPLAPMRLPIVDKWRDMGTIVMGKIESGFLQAGDVMQIMPNKLRVKIEAIYRDEKEVSATRSGENLRLRVTGAEETDISAGFVLSSIKNPVPIVTQFEAQLMIVELLEHNPIFTVGYKSILHIHTAVEECEITKLVCEIDMKTKDQKKTRFIKQGGMCICRITVDKPICIEAFSDVPALGRFTLRDEGRTIAIGKVMKLPKGRCALSRCGAVGVLLDAPWFRSPSVVAAYLQLLGFKATWRNQHLIPKGLAVVQQQREALVQPVQQQSPSPQKQKQHDGVWGVRVCVMISAVSHGSSVICIIVICIITTISIVTIMTWHLPVGLTQALMLPVPPDQSYHVMVSNHTTSADLMMLFQLPKRYIHLITTAMPAKVTSTRHLPVTLRPASAPVYTLLAQQAGEAGAAPVHVFPEGGLTNGSSMLQFSRGFTKFVKPGETWVVPVALRARTPFGIRTHTLTSSFLANLFFISLCPWLEVEAVVLPPTQQAAEEGRGAFVQRVQRAIAAELGVPVSQMTIKQKHTLMKAQRQRPEGV
ncbi:hypothetical protein QJQ45_022799 [Haematococcus lacustris]|nr:hypothetical protein QJQ45_022799 [Haematococcus lacustris]